jgi:hypothetical protein
MKTRHLATLTALILTATAGATARADQATLAWQEAGYVEEMVIVTGQRPAPIDHGVEVVYADSAPSSDSSLAWKQSGYVGEVVVATASRSTVLAEAREAMLEAARLRNRTIRPDSAMGTPAR